ncbi:MAG TPA: deoxynucleoside kinase [Candidatus Saccharimonadales bacterium]|nr:deoxynucleoside kinase [Candidatus Saccharimonadales bacterium]
MAEPSYIAVEGVIGVGKTSLARILSERLKSRLLLERHDENPFLAEFYRDRARYAFQTQMFFLFSRYEQQKELRQRDLFEQRVVADYLFQKDRIFASINLTDKELRLYELIAAAIEPEIPKPDIVVYLQAPTETLMKRIQKRGRPYESEMSFEYLEQLNEAYNYFFFHYEQAPLLVVNTRDIDFVENEADQGDLVHRILEHGEGVAYYAPLGHGDGA